MSAGARLLSTLPARAQTRRGARPANEGTRLVFERATADTNDGLYYSKVCTGGIEFSASGPTDVAGPGFFVSAGAGGGGAGGWCFSVLAGCGGGGGTCWGL